MERRKFLAVATSAFALGLAGCSGATDEENQSNETDEEAEPKSENEFAPNVAFNYDLSEGHSEATGHELRITNDSGEFEPARVTVQFEHGGDGDNDAKWHNWESGVSDADTVVAGDSITIGDGDGVADAAIDVQADWEVTIVWESESGDTTTEISNVWGPDA